jgi:hypothetical protein
MAPDHRINTVIPVITKLSLIFPALIQSATSVKGSSLLLDLASMALLAVYYTFTCEATRKILKDIVVLVMFNT